MEIEPYVFQADSDIVNDVYNNNDNYIIEYNKSVAPEYCIVYFSSNDIYYPNNELAFTESIIKKNRFEWFNTRVSYAYKHIFFRDIKKQWYLTGVNNRLNNPAAMAEFIRQESLGLKLILIGSSAGGFIATIIGQLLNAERIYTFNGQFEILTQAKKENAKYIDPVLYRNLNNSSLLLYYDTVNFIVNPDSIFYFHSSKSLWDIEQNNHLGSLPVNRLSFRTSNHGIPFLKVNLPIVLNYSLADLNKLSGTRIYPVLFSIRTVGLLKTFLGIKSVVDFALNKIYIRFIQK